MTGMTFEFPELSAKRLELQSVELLDPAEWAVAKAHGLTCAMGYAPAGDPKTPILVPDGPSL